MSTPSVHPFILEMLCRAQERMISVLVARLQELTDEPIVVTNDDLNGVDRNRLSTEPSDDLESITVRYLTEDELAEAAVKQAEAILAGSEPLFQPPTEG